jgi:hypothetical protein
VDRLGKGLTATAWAEDGTIEAFETDPAGPFLLAVQWHPEAGADLSLFRALAPRPASTPPRPLRAKRMPSRGSGIPNRPVRLAAPP